MATPVGGTQKKDVSGGKKTHPWGEKVRKTYAATDALRRTGRKGQCGTKGIRGEHTKGGEGDKQEEEKKKRNVKNPLKRKKKKKTNPTAIKATAAKTKGK